MRHIPFTNYIRGGQGRTEEILTPVQDDEYAKFLSLREQDCRLTVEMLSNGQISQCIEHPGCGDFDCVVTENGPAVVEQRRAMLLRFDVARLQEWKEAYDNG